MMLTACGSAGKSPPRLAEAPSPLLQVDVQHVMVCPAELEQPIPPRAAPPPGAVLRANDEADAYLDAKDGREDLLELRLRGAKADCDRQRVNP